MSIMPNKLQIVKAKNVLRRSTETRNIPSILPTPVNIADPYSRANNTKDINYCSTDPSNINSSGSSNISEPMIARGSKWMYRKYAARRTAQLMPTNKYFNGDFDPSDPSNRAVYGGKRGQNPGHLKFDSNSDLYDLRRQAQLSAMQFVAVHGKSEGASFRKNDPELITKRYQMEVLRSLAISYAIAIYDTLMTEDTLHSCVYHECEKKRKTLLEEGNDADTTKKLVGCPGDNEYFTQFMLSGSAQEVTLEYRHYIARCIFRIVHDLRNHILLMKYEERADDEDTYIESRIRTLTRERISRLPHRLIVQIVSKMDNFRYKRINYAGLSDPYCPVMFKAIVYENYSLGITSDIFLNFDQLPHKETIKCHQRLLAQLTAKMRKDQPG